MKKLIYFLILVIAAGTFSCNDPDLEASFEDLEKLTIYDYLMENEEDFSSFISILEKGGVLKTLSAYNPNGIGYTLFAPNNDAINQFVTESDQFSSVNDILSDESYAATFSRYHIVNEGVHSNEFPFGAFSEQTLSGDYLTVSFVIEADTSYYKINNQAAVNKPNIETSNGYVHHLEVALIPITFTSYQWLENNAAFSIFKQAIDLTGLKPLIDFNTKEEETKQAVTVLAEPDSIYEKFGIFSVDDLAAVVSPNNSDFTNSANGLYNFVAYHFLTGSYFLDDFVDENTNYNTMSEIPLNINGLGIDIEINPGKEMFDTIVHQVGDTTFVDYVGVLYDESNVITQSGAIHFINQLMKQQAPSRANLTYQFYEEPVIMEFYQEGEGSFPIEDPESLTKIEYSGSDLSYEIIKEDGEEITNAWNNDYLILDGDFTISYTTPQIVAGRYTVFLGAEAFNDENALVEVFIDGKKIGGLIDLTTLGTEDSPFQQIKLGNVDFKSYAPHKIEIRPLIPGRFLWDYIRFEIPK
ncbi:fasciclin domain-containing protein [Mariniphaga anaerophila]|nr:fasciclin domain-containing protein [Mariniphaga anaerophila]